MTESEASGDESSGLWAWIVTWGVMLRPGWHSVVVQAHDADEALVLAGDLHPELERPRTAFLARQEP